MREIGGAARLDLAAQPVIVLRVIDRLRAGGGQLEALGPLGVVLQVAADLGFELGHLVGRGALVLAALGIVLALLAGLERLAAHRRCGLARLRQQALLLQFELLDAALHLANEVALLRHGLRGQRRGRTLQVMVAAAVQVGLRQRGRVARLLRRFRIDQHHVKRRVRALDLEHLGRGYPHHQQQCMHDQGNGQRLGQRTAVVPPGVPPVAGSGECGVHDGGNLARKVRGGRWTRADGRAFPASRECRLAL
ncbi:hypothetical protein D9M68_684950 [compost metagenome]